LAAGEVVAATLCWDRRVETINPNPLVYQDGFFPYTDLSEVMNDMDLYLMRIDGDFNDPNDIVWGSVSYDSNVEHVFFPVPSAGYWKIVVANTNFGIGDAENYGLAWWAGESIPGDFDGDGDVDRDDLNKWKLRLGSSEADADDDGDTDGADFLAWQEFSGLNVVPTVPVPEPSSWLLACVGVLLSRRRQIIAILAILVGVRQPSHAAQMTLTRVSRSVTTAEAAGGAPSGGMVHDFRLTADADLLTLKADINVSLYQHPYASDNAAPNPALVAVYPAAGADSFLRLPSNTVMLGGGFTGPGTEHAWGDLSNDGPQNNFLFGQLTTTQVGTFSGYFALRGTTTYIQIPFSLSLPGPSGPLTESLSVSGVEQMQSTMSLAQPTLQTPVIEPSVRPTMAAYLNRGKLSAYFNISTRQWVKGVGRPRITPIPEPATRLMLVMAALLCRSSLVGASRDTDSDG
jgi:hypothetical protein